jgi:hypothetical protein
MTLSILKDNVIRLNLNNSFTLSIVVLLFCEVVDTLTRIM